jgi:hypothetical protein
MNFEGRRARSVVVAACEDIMKNDGMTFERWLLVYGSRGGGSV